MTHSLCHFIVRIDARKVTSEQPVKSTFAAVHNGNTDAPTKAIKAASRLQCSPSTALEVYIVEMCIAMTLDFKGQRSNLK